MPISVYFGGHIPAISHLVRPGGGLSGELWDLRKDVGEAFAGVENHVRRYHVPLVTPTTVKSGPGKEPTTVVVSTLVLAAFTLGVDDGYRQFKIPHTYVGSPSIHIHWSKTGDANEQTKTVRWRVTYSVFDGETEEATGITGQVDLDGTYLNSGTTTRIVYETADAALTGFVAGHYCSMKVEAVTPGGVAMVSEPGLFALDLEYNEYINK